ncbi:HNH endonuclease family protein [Corynebacterium sp. HS2168-gen11]|uniref:HNH endonuclease family protein n=1 Tax=Corynebacterium sp. HS2168-gen11 TaxID=2974027 RepID=UPI00216AE1C7|nr:HNH endonuclease family protein [Corynebacterium sp. HS2168-gen11]MCS4534833.1 HNH endonuclease family protein [Corynebacterium sp. HS2168-gen11]
MKNIVVTFGNVNRAWMRMSIFVVIAVWGLNACSWGEPLASDEATLEILASTSQLPVATPEAAVAVPDQPVVTPEDSQATPDADESGAEEPEQPVDSALQNVSEQLAALESLPIREWETTVPKYHRDAFGQRWSDDVDAPLGHNGCDTRNDILNRDLKDVVYKPKTHNCVVLSGVLNDPYTGETHQFVRGQGTSELVPIDHVVALADAWYAGAWKWDAVTRQKFANDPLNLQATTRAANTDKSAKAADRWMPPASNYRCEYARRQVQIKYIYGLAVLPQEKDTLVQVLSKC